MKSRHTQSRGCPMSKPFHVFFFVLMPKILLSRIAGWFCRRSVSRHLINWFIKKYNVALNEVEVPHDRFPTLNRFYTRRLLAGVHAISPEPDAVVSPVDAIIEDAGPVNGTRVMQVKENDYLLSDLLPASFHHTFIDGYFITLKIPTGEYHRVHAPVDGKITHTLYVPGTLFPLVEYMKKGIKNIYAKNERIAALIDTGKGKMTMCMVGAMCAGEISLSYSSIQSNAIKRKKLEKNHMVTAPKVQRGNEIAVFNLGSTVIMIFQADMFKPEHGMIGTRVRVGQKLGTLVEKRKYEFLEEYASESEA